MDFTISLFKMKKKRIKEENLMMNQKKLKHKLVNILKQRHFNEIKKLEYKNLFRNWNKRK